MAALSCLGENLDPTEVVMVGDDVLSDAIGALYAGLGRAIFVRTGKVRTRGRIGSGGRCADHDRRFDRRGGGLHLLELGVKLFE